MTLLGGRGHGLLAGPPGLLSQATDDQDSRLVAGASGPVGGRIPVALKGLAVPGRTRTLPWRLTVSLAQPKRCALPLRV